MSRADTLKVAKKILKSANRGQNEYLKYPMVLSDGFQYVSDSFSCLAVADHLDLPKRPKDLLTVPLDLYLKKERIYTVLEAPDVKKLGEYVKFCKANKQPCLYDFGPGRPLVNAEYLYDMLTAVGKCEMYYDEGPYDVYISNQLRFKSLDGKRKGFVMMVRRNKDLVYKKTNLEDYYE